MDKPFNWKRSDLYRLSVDCPNCGHLSDVVNAGLAPHSSVVKIEAICYVCDGYVYLVIDIPVNSLPQRGKKWMKALSS